MGAAIAAGSHLEKGIWALLVIAANIIIKVIQTLKDEVHMLRIFQCLWCIISPNLKRRNTSPMRFVRAVIIPAASDLGFW